MNRLIYFCTAIVASSTISLGSDLKDAKEILTKADEATKKVQAVRYKGSFKGTGFVAARQPAVEGTALIAGKYAEGRGKFRIEAKVTPSGSTETKEVSAGSDGETFWVIDSKTKTVHEDMDPNVMGATGRPVMALAMREFTHPTPFSDEIEAEKAELKEDKKIGSEECYQIHVLYARGQGEAVWCFSKKDFLPRGVERLVKNAEGQTASIITEVTSLEADPKLPEDAFKAVVPEGFKKTDEFAP